jgi:hypothetical protein
MDVSKVFCRSDVEIERSPTRLCFSKSFVIAVFHTICVFHVWRIDVNADEFVGRFGQ